MRIFLLAIQFVLSVYDNLVYRYLSTKQQIEDNSNTRYLPCDFCGKKFFFIVTAPVCMCMECADKPMEFDIECVYDFDSEMKNDSKNEKRN